MVNRFSGPAGGVVVKPGTIVMSVRLQLSPLESGQFAVIMLPGQTPPSPVPTHWSQRKALH